MSSRARSRQQVGAVVKALAQDTPSRECRTAAGRMESGGSGKQVAALEHGGSGGSGVGGGFSLLPSVRGLKPVSKTPPALQSPLRTPMVVNQTASGTGMSATAVDSEAQAIEEFREKFIKSGAIKFASLREAFRKIDANKNGEGVHWQCQRGFGVLCVRRQCLDAV